MKLYILFTAALLALSCRQQELPSPSGSEEDNVSFVATMNSGSPTKAALYADGPLASDVSLGLMAYKYSSDNAAASEWELHSSPAVAQVIYDSRTSGTTSGKWIPSASQRICWPGDGYYVRYFAYAPYGASGVTVSAANMAAPSISYTVPAPGLQKDLLVSNASSTRQYPGDPGWRNIDVPMAMKHALAGVRFRLPEGLEITSLSISGVYDSGSLDLSAPTAWSGQGGSAAYTLTNLSLGNGLRADSANPGFNITDDDATLILMPQVLPSGAAISVVLSNTRSITASIAGFTWPVNTLVTYTITQRSGLWVLLAEATSFDSEISDVVISPVNMREFDSEDGGLLEMWPDGTSDPYQYGGVPDFD